MMFFWMQLWTDFIAIQKKEKQILKGLIQIRLIWLLADKLLLDGSFVSREMGWKLECKEVGKNGSPKSKMKVLLRTVFFAPY